MHFSRTISSHMYHLKISRSGWSWNVEVKEKKNNIVTTLLNVHYYNDYWEEIVFFSFLFNFKVSRKAAIYNVTHIG